MAFQALLFGFIGGGALLIGALLGIYLKISRKVIALIMAFGAGVLICALSFDLMEEAYRRGGFDSVTIGFLVGALLFVFGDWLVDRKGGHIRKLIHSKRHLAKRPQDDKASGMAIFIGALLDGIPESAAIGIGLLANKGIGILMLVAVFLSNLPEGISGAASMLKAKKSKSFILSLWIGVLLICTLSAFLGYKILGNSSPDLIAAILALAAGAILAMITDTMIPEAFEEEGKIVALVTVLGFLLTFIISHLTK
jgi:ZIP family zinc transporter